MFKISKLKDDLVSLSKQCKSCFAQVPEKAKFCSRCGEPVAEDPELKNRCPKCMRVLKPEAKFCPSCGTRIKSAGFAKMRHLYAPEGERHKCTICSQEIDIDLIFCPSCVNPFHYSHLVNWLLKEKKCPVCRTKLEFID